MKKVKTLNLLQIMRNRAMIQTAVKMISVSKGFLQVKCKKGLKWKTEKETGDN